MYASIPTTGVEVGLARRSVEVEDAVHVPVVGDADRGLAVGDGLGDDVGDPGRAVEHRVLGVQVQVDERTRHGRYTALDRAHDDLPGDVSDRVLDTASDHTLGKALGHPPAGLGRPSRSRSGVVQSVHRPVDGPVDEMTPV